MIQAFSLDLVRNILWRTYQIKEDFLGKKIVEYGTVITHMTRESGVPLKPVSNKCFSPSREKKVPKDFLF